MDVTIRADEEFVVDWQLRPAQAADVVIDLTSKDHHPEGTRRSGRPSREDFAVVTGTPPSGRLRQAGTKHAARRSQSCWS